jgi:putative flippase GtrA
MPTFLESLILKIFPSMDRFWEVFRFLAVGGGCFLLEYVLLFTLTEYGGLRWSLHRSLLRFPSL